MRAYFLLILLCFIGSSARSQSSDSTTSESGQIYTGEIKATTSIDAKQVPQNRFVIYTVTVTWNGDLDRYQIEKMEPPVLTNFEIIGTASSNWVGEVDGVQQSIAKYEFKLSPTELGMAYIDGVIVEYTDVAVDKTRRLVTSRLEVEVTEPVVERDFSMLLVAGAGLLLLVLAGGVAAYAVRRKKMVQAEKARLAEAAIPVEEKYFGELKRSVDLSNTDTSGSFSALSRIFKHYLSERYGIPAAEQTTDEIASGLANKAVSESMIEKTREILRTCDVAKFSGGSPEHAGLERIYTLVEDILTTNKSQFIDEINTG